jgi:hypothetical protein
MRRVGRYAIEENGCSGEVEVRDDRIVRTRMGPLGQNVETIPIGTVNGVSHDRKRLATDEVTLQVGKIAYRWKVKRADDMLAELHRIRFVTAALYDPGSTDLVDS